MRIALDVDGVLADVIESWLGYSNSIRPEISKEEMTDWDFWRKHGIDQYDFYKELNSCWNDWESIPPTEEGLSSATERLSELGRVDIVTARERSTDPFVRSWLDHHGISYDDYVSVIHGPMKAELDYDVFIDDSPLNAQEFLKRDKRMILYTQPWNLHVSDIRIERISSLSESVKILESG